MIKRRTFLGSGAVALAMPALARAESESVLRFVPQADLAVLDPVWTTTYQTRDHGFLVFDTLFGLDDQFTRAAADGRGCAAAMMMASAGRITLRDGLKFQDNTPVLARDCAASVKRWGARDAFGQALMAATDEISAPDDKTLVFRLKRPFPLLPDALAKTPPTHVPDHAGAFGLDRSVQAGDGDGRQRPLSLHRERAGVRARAWCTSGSRATCRGAVGCAERHGRAEGRAFRPDRVADHPRRRRRSPAALQTGEVDWWLTPGADLAAGAAQSRES